MCYLLPGTFRRLTAAASGLILWVTSFNGRPKQLGPHRFPGEGLFAALLAPAAALAAAALAAAAAAAGALVAAAAAAALAAAAAAAAAPLTHGFTSPV